MKRIPVIVLIWSALSLGGMLYAQLVVKEGTNEYFKVNETNGNVSIGLDGATATAKLDVDGAIRFRSLVKGSITNPVLVVDSDGNLSVSEDATEDVQPLSEVLSDGGDAANQEAWNFSTIGIGVSNALAVDSRLRVKGSVSSTLPYFGTYNTSIYASDYLSPDAEKQVVIEGIGTVMSTDQNSAHLGVQGMLMGGSEHDVWITSASLGYHNTNIHNVVAGVSSNVLPVDGHVPATDLRTAVLSGKNHNSGTNHYGLHVEASNNYLTGNLNLEGKLGINLGGREPATWFEISGQPYISAANAGIMMKSSDGSCWQVRVDNSGNLFTTSRACP